MVKEIKVAHKKLDISELRATLKELAEDTVFEDFDDFTISIVGKEVPPKEVRLVF
jgi:hypothetical protein